MPTQTTTTPKPGPVVTELTRTYWAAAEDGTLLIQQCGTCHTYQHYPARMCRTCWSEDIDWVKARGTGTVWTFTVVGIPGHPAWKAESPYILALVELDEGPRLMTNIVGSEPGDVRVGQRVALAPAATEQPALQFKIEA
ncbi:hypothetical protein CH298_02365 [Rhodococcoides fascians]|nr:OB-fold domain-containing protein [Rhodococcus fascians]OZD80395.1 hypothetical protein CH258_20820 [Rhodococcus sp. 05-2256-B4]OZD87545.1 hypothetical protein CH257_25395 [Rhodococcus sp. 05-2256-B3]OZD94898.1 hypothetical protein CH260_15480 [Rhodococcus sp. 05-2256-B2]OZE08082.1 hypothetical protein CH285_04140 [Rhodococcus sp. 05-2256-B1]